MNNVRITSPGRNAANPEVGTEAMRMKAGGNPKKNGAMGGNDAKTMSRRLE